MNRYARVPDWMINTLWFALLYLAGCAPTTPTPALMQATLAPAITLPPTQQPTASPTPEGETTLEAGQWTFLFYHEGLEQIVLVNGGPERGKPADDPLGLWSWDGTKWSLISAEENGPVWRNWAAVAYDSTRDVLVIHGGIQSAGLDFDETWEWNGETWVRFTEAGPGAREGALMVYDVAREKSILFGGATENLEVQGDTWEWDGELWTQLSETGPAPRFPGGMIYDPARQDVLMYSGHFAETTGEFIDYDDLWAWDGISWSDIVLNGPTPGHRTHAALVFDPKTEKVLLTSSGSQTFLSDVWAWDGTKWEEVQTSNAPSRSGHNVAYDPNRDRFVLFGGVERPGGNALTDTWEWDRVRWTCVDNCQ